MANPEDTNEIPFYIDQNSITEELQRELAKKKDKLLYDLENGVHRGDPEILMKAKEVIEKIETLLEASDLMKKVGKALTKKFGNEFLVESSQYTNPLRVGEIYGRCLAIDKKIAKLDENTGIELRRKGKLTLNLKITENEVDILYDSLLELSNTVDSFKKEFEAKLEIASNIITLADTYLKSEKVAESSKKDILFVRKSEGQYKEFYESANYFTDIVTASRKLAVSTLNYKESTKAPSLFNIQSSYDFIVDNIETVLAHTVTPEEKPDNTEYLGKLENYARCLNTLAPQEKLKTLISGIESIRRSNNFDYEEFYTKADNILIYLTANIKKELSKVISNYENAKDKLSSLTQNKKVTGFMQKAIADIETLKDWEKNV